MCSVQSSLLFLYYSVVFSVKPVQYCLCVSRIQCTQCSVSVCSVGSVLKRSMQVVFRVYSISSVSQAFSLQGRVCSMHSQWCSLLAGYSLRRSWSAYYYSVSVVFSLAFSCQWGSESILCSVSVQCLQRSGCVLFSGSFSVCTLQCLQCSEHWLFTKSLSCSESTL